LDQLLRLTQHKKQSVPWSAPEDKLLSFFPGATPLDWENWQWHFRNRISTLQLLEQIIPLTKEEREGIKKCGKKLNMAITPYFLCQVNPSDSECPIRRQCIPTVNELTISEHELGDPCGEEKYSPVPCLVHRYPDRVLFLVSNQCAMYCRHCTRSRITGEDLLFSKEMYRQAIAYIREHKEVRDVLLSGGDPLTLSDNALEALLKEIRSIKHVEFLRIGTRMPVTLPQRITEELLTMFKKYSPIWMSLHFNHPREITPRVKAACNLLADNGIPLGSQTVLLKGVNDDPVIMKKLMHELLKIRVKPYYLYQCDPVIGTKHFRTTIETGINIIENLRGFTSGYAVPTFVIDGPGGGGKIPVGPQYVVSKNEDEYILRNYQGKKFSYKNPKN